MARTALAVQEIVTTGLTPSYTSANADGHSINNVAAGTMFLHVKNGSESSIDVTLQTPATVGGVAVEDPVVAVAAGAEKLIGPFPARPFNQAGGTVYVDFSAVTSITVAALRIQG